jgi:formate dehydrogenase iron-sulfur subunit
VFDEKTLQIRAISGHPGSVPGKGVQRQVEVCKLMDTTTCIGCKACEVACVEWNDMPFQRTTFDNTYQTMPETTWNFWQLMKFHEVQRMDDGSLAPFQDGKHDGNLMWIFRKDQCMHCADPGCLRACPADGAIVQYENGIVDFQQENCIGCQLCVSGCPFNIPKFNQTTKKVYKCTLCSDRVGQGLEPACIKACPTGCLQFGTKPEMKEIAEKRAVQLREHSGFKNAGVWDPESIDGTHVIYVLHDVTQPELYGDLPKNPRIPIVYTVWKYVLKPISLFGVFLGAIGMAFHYVGYGPKRTQPEPPAAKEMKEEDRGNR